MAIPDTASKNWTDKYSLNIWVEMKQMGGKWCMKIDCWFSKKTSLVILLTNAKLFASNSSKQDWDSTLADWELNNKLQMLSSYGYSMEWKKVADLSDAFEMEKL